MDTIQIIKINEEQLLVTLNSKEAIKLNLKFNDLKTLIRKINHNTLNDYINLGSNKDILNQLKETSYELFNILHFFNFKDLFTQFKKNTFNHIELIVDKDTNQIPFELLHDGKDFLSDFIIFSRSFVDSINKGNNDSIELNEPFSIVCDPSESKDIMIDVNAECNNIADLIDPLFDLKGPYRKRYVNKIELIHLLGTSSLLHFSGHYTTDSKNNGWKLFDDSFTSIDIKKILKSPTFIFSNTCGGSSDFFVHSFLNKGSQSIIASLGNLPSEKASQFSQNFYKYFINDNLNLGESFFLAKRDMIVSYGKEDLFWCFYQIYGSGLLKIKRKNNKTINRKSEPLYILSFLLLALSFLFIFNYFKNQNYKEEESKFILEKLVIMKDNKHLDAHSNIDSSKNVINISGKDSIYFKLVDNQPIFSLNPYFEGLDLFIHSENNVQTFFNYNNDTLHLHLNNQRFQNDDDYYKINLYLNNNYKNVELYIKKIDINITDYELYLFNKNNNQRYKILLSKLIDKSEKYEVITQNDLDVIGDSGKDYSYSVTKFDLIKNNIIFNKELTLYIKKTLLD